MPIRIAVWSALMLVFVIQFIWGLLKRQPDNYWLVIKDFFTKKIETDKKWPAAKIFLVLFFFILVGLINGVIRHHSLSIIFSDFNAWLYWLLLFPAIVVYGSSGQSVEQTALHQSRIARLKTIFLAGALWISLETLFLLFVFTHNLPIAADIYSWLRRTILGEMTMTATGWPRIFIQGQIYAGLGFWLSFWVVFWREAQDSANRQFKNLFSRQNIWPFIIGALFLSALLISFSRSFWVAMSIVALISLFLIGRFFSGKKYLAPRFG